MAFIFIIFKIKVFLYFKVSRNITTGFGKQIMRWGTKFYESYPVLNNFNTGYMFQNSVHTYYRRQQEPDHSML